MRDSNNTANYELQRLAALQAYQITDTLNEKDYDDIAKLASAICGTPMSLVTFVDEKWQWFKARVGTEFSGTPREIAFCEYTIKAADEVMIVEDATTDVRFANNPLVTQDPNIRFYAGAPFTTDDGFTLGTVCVIDMVPRTLTPHQTEALQILSRQVSTLLKTRKMNIELASKNQFLNGRNEIMIGEVEQLQDQLQVIAAEHIHEISQKNAELTRINRELEAFAYISSHDLQEPLRKIQTFSSWLIESESDRLSQRGNEYLIKIGTSAGRMQRLIGDLLHYSRISMSAMRFEELELKDVVAPVIDDLQQEILSKNARIDIFGTGRLFVVGYQFQQVFYNLLSNALKFSRVDCAPQISITLSHETFGDAGEPHFCITFADNGVGFDNQYCEQIFSLFQRLGNETKVAGTGIGLTIVRKIVSNHGGTITAKGSPNQGATFTIKIPDQNAGPSLMTEPLTA